MYCFDLNRKPTFIEIKVKLNNTKSIKTSTPKTKTGNTQTQDLTIQLAALTMYMSDLYGCNKVGITGNIINYFCADVHSGNIKK